MCRCWRTDYNWHAHNPSKHADENPLLDLHWKTYICLFSQGLASACISKYIYITLWTMSLKTCEFLPPDKETVWKPFRFDFDLTNFTLMTQTLNGFCSTSKALYITSLSYHTLMNTFGTMLAYLGKLQPPNQIILGSNHQLTNLWLTVSKKKQPSIQQVCTDDLTHSNFHFYVLYNHFYVPKT